MHIPVFRVLCPSYASEYLESHKIKGKEIKETDQVLIGCTADERKALEALLILREKKLYITLYSERPPTALLSFTTSASIPTTEDGALGNCWSPMPRPKQ